ncbi:hypothetical protein [Actinophytocola xanthii]|uniref:Transcriptional regulator n=1 Tax=Actinophytocola xanthii TaxID=1912961 RepID=A0A1Q8CSR5_9PSEU|nr:hypothetical protein [Actinophytocola xanthii]OLF17409.1 hypothetical protein BU204_11580 [Actinophytocola xanthii]
MEEASISNKGLAARVRAEAEKSGLVLSTDHVAVRRWLNGVQPHADTIPCIAAALSAKLGRAVTPADIGFESRGPVAEGVGDVDDSTEYPAEPEQAVDTLDSLTTADLADSSALASADWVSEAAPRVITGYLFGEPHRIEYAATLDEAGRDIAARIRATVRYFMDLDFKFGGGHTRRMLLFYWQTEIVPALRQHHPEAVRREVFSAAADAAEVLGWSAYDDGRHGAAQRYFIQGLRLAREADDHLMGGQILSNLSHQANYLGNFSDAIQFARAAQAATNGNASATVSAMFLAMEARALASIGDARRCAEILHRAEQMFERSDPDKDPDWISYFDALELAGEAAHCFRDLGQSAQTQQFTVQAVDPVLTPPRTRAFIDMVSAAATLTDGHLEEAVSIATNAVGLASGLQSRRYIRYLTDFHRSLVEKAPGHSSVREFAALLEQAHPLAITPGGARTAANRATARLEASASGPRTPRQSPQTRTRSA